MSFYTVGGHLTSEKPSYITRQADRDLYHFLKGGYYCYILNARQMGKSSLKNNIISKLKQENYLCCSIDLSGFSTSMTPDKWYRQIAKQIIKKCKLNQDFELNRWWDEQEDASSPQAKLETFIEDILLPSISKKIVIFLDEIDILPKFDNGKIGDDFLRFIRYCYEQRAEHPNYNRLNWVLIGVAHPDDLIQDKEYSPFNIGKKIDLKGFTLEEALPLTEGFKHNSDNPELVLEIILDWTGGQPFLTQKVCKLVVSYLDYIYNQEEKIKIDALIQEKIIDYWEFQDDPVHLRAIRDRLISEQDKSIEILQTYKVILNDKNENTAKNYGKFDLIFQVRVLELLLSGLVVKRGNNLKTFNNIYKKIFTMEWVEEELYNISRKISNRQWSNNTQQPSGIYKNKLQVWMISEYKDDSQLLNEHELSDTIGWVINHNISDLDKKFIQESQERIINYNSLVNANTMIQLEDKIIRENQQLKKRIKILWLVITFIVLIVLGTPKFKQVTQLAQNYVSQKELQKKIEATQRMIETIETIANLKSESERQKQIQSSSQNLHYFCFQLNGVWTTGVRSSRGEFISLIRWTNDQILNWSPRRRCIEVSKRMQLLASHGLFNAMSGGIVNRQPVICGVRQIGETCTNRNLLVTLKPSDNPSQVMSKMLDFSSVERGNIPEL